MRYIWKLEARTYRYSRPVKIAYFTSKAMAYRAFHQVLELNGLHENEAYAAATGFHCAIIDRADGKYLSVSLHQIQMMESSVLSRVSFNFTESIPMRSWKYEGWEKHTRDGALA